MNGELGFVSTQRASSILGLSPSTLRRLADNGDIQCIRNGPKGHRYYNVDKYVDQSKSIETIIQNSDKKRICYCRVSSKQQKDDLQRQVQYMRNLYPEHEIVTDIGSGLNFQRKGFKTILDQAIKGRIGQIVVAHKDRLCRFGFEFIEDLIKTHSKGQIVVLNENKSSPEEELAKDILQILTIFSARVNGYRKYAHKIKKDKNIPQPEPKKHS